MEVIQRWPKRADAILCCCGDVSDDLGRLEEALRLLVDRFAAVFFVPGNHELWIRRCDRSCGVHDSLSKLVAVLELCASLGVHVTPRRVGRTWVAPLLSWHHKSWDREPDIAGIPPATRLTVADYAACHWPASLPGADSPGAAALAAWVDALNDTPAWRQALADRAAGTDLLAMAHFLPSQARQGGAPGQDRGGELLPEKRFLYFANLAKAVGSQPLARRVATARPDLALFGHSHFGWDATLADGTRYMQTPLCSPAERLRRLHTVAWEGGGAMEAAAADPLAARWLPVCVYQTLVPRRELEALRGRSRAGACGRSLAGMLASMREALAAAAAGAGDRQVAAPPGVDLPPASPPAATGGADEDQEESLLLELNERVHSVPSDAESEGEAAAAGDDLPEAAAAARAALDSCSWEGSSSLSGSSFASASDLPAEQVEQQRQAWAAAGWTATRNGALAPPLFAHWSSYYSINRRTPEVTTPAPWVAKRWERRRRRTVAGTAAGGSAADEALQS